MYNNPSIDHNTVKELTVYVYPGHKDSSNEISINRGVVNRFSCIVEKGFGLYSWVALVDFDNRVILVTLREWGRIADNFELRFVRNMRELLPATSTALPPTLQIRSLKHA